MSLRVVLFREMVLLVWVVFWAYVVARLRTWAAFITTKLSGCGRRPHLPQSHCDNLKNTLSNDAELERPEFSH
jgi:hypothetical protein